MTTPKERERLAKWCDELAELTASLGWDTAPHFIRIAALLREPVRSEAEIKAEALFEHAEVYESVGGPSSFARWLRDCASYVRAKGDAS